MQTELPRPPQAQLFFGFPIRTPASNRFYERWRKEERERSAQERRGAMGKKEEELVGGGGCSCAEAVDKARGWFRQAWARGCTAGQKSGPSFSETCAACSHAGPMTFIPRTFLASFVTTARGRGGGRGKNGKPGTWRGVAEKKRV